MALPVCLNLSYLGWSVAQGAANQFEMWSEESLFLLVLYKGMKTKLGLRRGLQKNFNKWPTCCCPSEKIISNMLLIYDYMKLFCLY